MPKAEIDYPRVRAACKCPLCGGSKEPGVIACWPCYRRNLKDGNCSSRAASYRMLDAAEAAGGAI